MKEKDLAAYVTLDELRAASAAGLTNGQGHDHRMAMGGDHRMGDESPMAHNERTASYRGHAIRIVTHYEVFIDGVAVQVPFHVSNDGYVTTHVVPNYASVTAVDVAKRIIDAYPHRYPPEQTTKGRR